MILKRRVALNGIWMDEIDKRIVISSVEPEDGKENITAVDAAGGYGQRITGNRRSTLDMVVTFRLLEHGRNVNGMTARGQLLEKVNAWAAAGGVLTVNYKPERRLNVILVRAPGEGSLWDYTKEFTLTFRAYRIPYWEDEMITSVSAGENANSGSGAATIGGSVKTQVSAMLENTSGMNINTATVTIGGKTMNFSGLNMGNNEALIIDYSGDGILRIRIRSAGGSYRSAMACRSDTSADEFTAIGDTGISFTAQRACRLTASWRCRYL